MVCNSAFQNFFRNRLPCLNHRSFQTLASIFGVEPKRRRHRYFLDVFFCFFLPPKLHEGPRRRWLQKWLQAPRENRFTRDESTKNPTGRSLENAWRIKLPRKQKSFERHQLQGWTEMRLLHGKWLIYLLKKVKTLEGNHHLKKKWWNSFWMMIFHPYGIKKWWNS